MPRLFEDDGTLVTPPTPVLQDNYGKRQMMVAEYVDGVARAIEEKTKEEGTFSRSIRADQETINSAYTGPINEKYGRDAAAKAIHDISYMDSMEYAVRNQVTLAKYEEKYPQLMTKEQANSFAKEAGVDIKFDRDITEGAVRLRIQREKQKQEAFEEFARYASTGDDSALHNARMMLSALSGAFTFTDIATIGATAWMEGLGIAKAATGIAKTADVLFKTGKVKNLATGIKVAEQIAINQKRINAYERSAKVAEDALVAKSILRQSTKLGKENAKLTKSIQSMDVGQKIAYGTTRFGMGMKGESAGLVSDLVPWFVDGVVTELPRATALGINSVEMQDGSFDAKRAFGEIMLAGGMGAAIPVGYHGARGLGRALHAPVTNITKKAVESVQDFTASMAMKAEMKGNKGGAEAFRATEESGIEIMESAREAASTPLNPQTVKDAENIANANTTNDELQMYLMDIIENGKFDPNILLKYDVLSHIPGMRDTLKEMAESGSSVDDIYRYIIEKLGEQTTHNTDNVWDQVAEAASWFSTEGRPIVSKFSIETGMLGRQGAAHINRVEANRLLTDIYLANMLKGTEAGTAAFERAQASIGRLKDIRDMLVDITSTYNAITTRNKQAEGLYRERDLLLSQMKQVRGDKKEIEELKSKVDALDKQAKEKYISYENQERLYNSGIDIENASIGDIRNATGVNLESKVRELFDLLLPEEVWQEASIEDIQKIQDAFIKAVTEEHVGKKGGVFLNLRALSKGEQGHTNKFEAVAAELDHIIKSNEDLLNSIDNLERKYGTPEELAEEVRKGKYIPETEYFNRGVRVEDNATANKYLSDLDAAVAENNRVSAEFEAAFSSLSDKEKQAFDYASKDIVKDGEKKYLVNPYIANLRDQIAATNAFFDMPLKDFADNIIAALQKDEKFGDKRYKFGSFDSAYTRKVITSDFKRVTKQAIKDTILAKVEDKSVGMYFDTDMLDAYLDRAAQDFLGKLETNPDMFRHVVAPPQEATTVAEAFMQDRTQREAEAAIREMLDPYMTEVTKQVIEMRKSAMLGNIHLLNEFQRALKYGVRPDEHMLGLLTTSAYSIGDSSLNVENLSRIDAEHNQIQRAIVQAGSKDIDGTKLGGQELLAEANNPNNKDNICKAMIRTMLMDKGELSEAERKAFQPNTKEGMIARAILDSTADLKYKVQSVGGKLGEIFHPFSSSKLATIGKHIPDDAGMQGITSMNKVLNSAFNKDGKFASLNRLFFDESREGQRMANEAGYLFANLDLDKTFHHDFGRIPYNQLRDAILDESGEYTALRSLIANHGDAKVQKAVDELVGRFVNDTEWGKHGLLLKVQTGAEDMLGTIHVEKGRYINDQAQQIFFKDLAATDDAMKYLGYDTIDEWITASLSKAKQKYAVLSKLSTEPKQFMDSLCQLVLNYYKNVPISEVSLETKNAATRALTRPYFIQTLNNNLRTVCGGRTTPAGITARLIEIFKRINGAGMVVASGFRSLTDYHYMYYDAVHMGLASQSSLADRARIEYGRVATLPIQVMRKLKFGQHAYLSNAIRNDHLMKAYGAVEATVGRGKLNKYADIVDRLEQGSQQFADFVLNSVGQVSAITQASRDNAALTICEGIGAFKNTSFAQLAKMGRQEDNFQKLLTRYGVDEIDWEVLRAEGITDYADYMTNWSGIDAGLFKGLDMFVPEKVADMSDDAVRNALTKKFELLKSQGRKVPKEITDDMVKVYKARLVDSAFAMVNASADEMMTFPTARVRNTLNFGFDKNTGMGAAIGLLTQFQSFGLACTKFHWERQLASYMDWDAVAAGRATSLLSAFFNNGKFNFLTAGTMASFVAEGMLLQMALNEAIAYTKGTRKPFFDEKGDLQVGDKLVSALVDQAGIYGVAMDALLSFGPRGTGGGIALSVAPSASSALKGAQNIAGAATKEGTKGHRVRAVSSAIGLNLASTIGITRLPIFKPVFTWLIGDQLDEWQRGEEAWDRLKRRRKREGRGESLLQKMTGYETLSEALP